MPASDSKYRKLARFVFQGYSWPDAGVASGVHKNRKVARAKAYALKRNVIVKEELEKLNKAENYAIVMTKQEKLEKSALLSRAVSDKLQEQIESDQDLDHKLMDSYIKLGKRDDVLQGHQIQAETNPQDKIDAAVSEWVMSIRKDNDVPNKMRIVKEEVIELEDGEGE